MTPQRYKTSEVARLAGVSPATVSRVLNHREQVSDATAHKVEEALRQLGVEPAARAPRRQRRKDLILVNYPLSPNPFYEEVIQGIITSAAAHGFAVVESHGYLTDGTIADFLELLRTVGASGVITFGQHEVRLLAKVQELVPVVQCCEYNEASNAPYVSIDDRAAAQRAVEFLVSAGRSRIALLNGPGTYKYARERRRGYLAAMEAAGLEAHPDWLMQVPRIDYTMAQTVVSQLLVAGEVPDAIFCASDVLAAAAINAARRYHLHVPDDLMVVGFDNVSISQMVRPSITTVAQPRNQLGYTAAEVLVDHIAHEEASLGSILLPTELVVRESAVPR